MSVLTVSLDASQLSPDERKQQKIKVGVRSGDGKIQSRIVAVDKERVDVRFEVDERGALDVAVGPDEADDEDLHKLQTLTARVAPPRLEVPLQITPFFWRFWLTWCRKITITGRVLCPDGRPAPGARVTAYDVDFVWWWWSREQVGPAATTDANGVFTISFRWCCGWLPIWWWRLRHWALEPVLASRILSVLRLDDRRRPPTPDPVPDLRVFAGLLGPGRPLPSPRRPFDPTELPKLREPLLQRLPRLPDLERLRLWPWFPWTPWLDCTPDIIFRVTQNCDGVEKTIVAESVFDVRWDIPNALTVTLMANADACCTTPPPPHGDCIVLTHACGVQITDIEQDPTSPLVGLANPGDPVDDADQPFAGEVRLHGQFGDGAHVDYYEIEHTQTPGVAASWAPIPPETAGGFTRYYYDIPPGGPVISQPFPVAFTVIDGVNVAESVEHFEAGHPPPVGTLRIPVGGQDTLVHLQTADNFGDGVYYFRVMGYTLDAAGHLINGRVLPLCNTDAEHRIALRFDNRFVDNTSPFTPPPSSPTQPCGPGTVHTCTEEPDTRILAVRYNGVEVPPCGVVDTRAGGSLDIDFMAYDPDGFLHSYALVAKYGESLEVDLLTTPMHTLTAVSLLGPPPQADHVGPRYRLAVPAGGPPPPTWTWRGGEITLHIPNVRDAFPVTCAYVLQLDAWKRTIANCDDSRPYWNRSHYALTVQV
jgi:hypothetical protein